MPLIKSLSLDKKPDSIDAAGNVLFVDNPGKKEYIVWDAAQEAPVGFGVKVSVKKTFVVRRRIDGKAIMPTVGNVTDYIGEKSPLSTARAQAASLVLEMRDTRSNPNVEARKRSVEEMTVGDALASYRKHCATRTQKPASVESLKAYDTDIRKVESYGWSQRKIIAMSLEEIMDKFVQELERAPGAAERAFNFLIRSVNWCIDQEALKAAVKNRLPLLQVNPFKILRINRMFRTREQLEAHRQTNGSRNPLTPSRTFGHFLEAAWSRRNYNDNETGVDFLITQLAIGCRKSEHGPCQWGELLTPQERLVTSHVMLDNDEDQFGPYIFFYWTKNRKSHKLPLGPMVVKLLRRRRDSCAAEVMSRENAGRRRLFVFPARSPSSKTGHYSDPKALLGSIRGDAEIPVLENHDLRRSFGAMMATLGVPEGCRRRFLNHAHPDVTSIYTVLSCTEN